ncbi:MRL1, partial [Symbiodinium sp. KB8]
MHKEDIPHPSKMSVVPPPTSCRGEGSGQIQLYKVQGWMLAAVKAITIQRHQAESIGRIGTAYLRAHVNVPGHGSSELADPAGVVGFAVGLSEEGKEEGAGKVVKHWRGFSVDQPLAVQVVVAGAADHL